MDLGAVGMVRHMGLRDRYVGRAPGVQRGAARADRTVRRCPSFSTLPDDILLLIYRLLAESPSRRARFAAVCSSWCAAIVAEPRVPALPWLLLSPRGAHDRTWRVHCPEDGAAMRLQPLPGAVGRGLVGGYDGGWVVSSRPLLRIVNLFTSAEVPLSEKQRRIPCLGANLGPGDARGPLVPKIVLSQPPTSDGCIMAAMTKKCGIMLCGVGCPAEGWTICAHRWMRFKDIAFCNGDLYCMARDCNKLLKCGIGVNKDGAPVVTTYKWIDMQMLDHSTSTNPYKDNASYIVGLNGYLTVVAINRWWDYPNPFFRMFKHINTNTWSQMRWLDDHALFLGPTFSKAVYVPTCSHGDIQRNHVYYSNGLSRNSEAHGDAVFLAISNKDGDLKYNMEHMKIIADNYRIKSVGYFVKDGHHDSMWFLPPDI